MSALVNYPLTIPARIRIQRKQMFLSFGSSPQTAGRWLLSDVFRRERRRCVETRWQGRQIMSDMTEIAEF
ncbi:unnamed protein product [Nezara viridula]|uniref:Uncharacterized protein n=1 Tax=Nezara viridula TaxID=85310 RepID=A0A9P0HBQ8_NEZVI|nr:unnamed protein product [Nezara viridula]